MMTSLSSHPQPLTLCHIFCIFRKKYYFCAVDAIKKSPFIFFTPRARRTIDPRKQLNERTYNRVIHRMSYFIRASEDNKSIVTECEWQGHNGQQLARVPCPHGILSDGLLLSGF